MSYFSVKNLHKQWPSANVKFNYECNKGEMTCILGPSGSGKSTILNIIAGLEKNDDNSLEIVLDDLRIENLAPQKRGVGMVFQSGALFNHLNVCDNVAYGLISNGIKKSQAREEACEYIKNFNLQGLENRMPQTLSGGEKQRVALARTLITQPKLVLLDEPLSALDAELRHRLANQIREWQKKIGFTAIMVTHDESEAQYIADKIVRIC
ncbi:MAG: ABC transporter ATP-binding protein [Spirochaetales bacterium]|nr:ABC transporter ATP-binding protein [Spirochaetales bacterium]